MNDTDVIGKDKGFERLREGIRIELIKAKQFSEIYWQLKDPPKELRKIRNLYISFVYFTVMASLFSFVISIHNLTDCRKDTANIPKLLNYIRSSPLLSKKYITEELNQINNMIFNYSDLRKRIDIYRDKYVAHNELKSLVIPPPTFTKDEVEKIIGDMAQSINQLSSNYDQKALAIEVTPKLDVNALLQALKEQHDSEIKRLRQLIRPSA